MNKPPCKVCTQCLIHKPLSDFGKRAAMLDGHKSQCKLCDSTKRMASYHEDSSSSLASSRRWKDEHKEEVRRYAKAYEERNRVKRLKYLHDNSSKISETHRLYRLNNKDKKRESCERYRLNNKEVAARHRKGVRRASTYTSEVDSLTIKGMYLLRDLLTLSTGMTHHVDHIIPINGVSVSGLHVAGNLQILTATDNIRKSNKWVIHND